MSVHSINSDDLSFEDFDTPVNVEIPSPLSNPSSLPPPDDADLTAMTSDSPKETVTPQFQEKLASLVPMLQNLPGLTLVDSVYYIYGSINETDRERLLNYTARVGELTLTDENDTASKLSPGIFVRLAKLQTNEQGSLFPSLHLLRIDNALSYLDSLDLFATPSLRTLEITRIPKSHQTPLLVFLKAAVVEIPDLDALRLGPGYLSLDVLQTCARFSSLRRLELEEIAVAFDFTLVEQIGGLVHLEALVVSQSTGGDGVYTSRAGMLRKEEEEKERREKEAQELARIAEEEEKERREKEAQELAKIAEEEERKRLEEEKSKVVELSPEEAKRLEEEQRFEQVRNMLLGIPYGGDLAVRLEEEKRCYEEMAREIEMEEEMLRKEEEEIQARIKLKPKKGLAGKKLKKSSVIPRGPPPQPPSGIDWGNDLGWSTGPPPQPFGFGGFVAPGGVSVGAGPLQGPQDLDATNDPGHHDQARSPSPTPSEYGRSSPVLALAEPELFALLGQLSESGKLFPALKTFQISGNSDLIKDIVGAVSSDALNELQITFHGQLSEEHDHIGEFAASRWRESLASVILKTMADPASSPNKLSKSMFKKILNMENVRHIDLSSWNIEDISDGLLVLPLRKLKLETLLLPFHPAAAGISLKKLGIIAEACPNLVSLQCRLKHLANVPEFPLGTPIRLPLTGKLQVLSIGNAEPHQDPKRLVLIARYIDVLFPNLKMIETYDGPEQNAEQWKHIFYLVETLCKTTRFDAQSREASK